MLILLSKIITNPIWDRDVAKDIAIELKAILDSKDKNDPITTKVPHLSAILLA